MSEHSQNRPEDETAPPAAPCPLAGRCTRRAFTAGAAAAAFLAALPEAEARKLAFRLSKVRKLQHVGGWVILRILGRKILFIRDAKDSVRALDAICTHKHYVMRYMPAERLIACPGHGSRYALDGAVKKGPSEKPLGVYRCRLVNGRVLVDL